MNAPPPSLRESMPLPDLPPELHHLILLHSVPYLARETPSFHPPSIAAAREALLRFSYVSPSFLHWSQKILYESIHLDSVERMMRLVVSIKANKDVRRRVRILRLGMMNGDGWSWSERERTAFGDLLDVLADDLKELRITRCWGVGVKEIGCAKGLERLYLLNCSFNILGPDGSPHFEVPDGTSPLILPALRHLYLTEVTVPAAISSTLLTHTAFPSLTSLAFALNRFISVRPATVHIIPNGQAPGPTIPILISNTRTLSLTGAISDGLNDKEDRLKLLHGLRGLSSTDNKLDVEVRRSLGENLEVFDCWGHLLLLDDFRMVERIPKSIKKLRLNFGGKAPSALPENLVFVATNLNGANEDDEDEIIAENDPAFFQKIPWMVELATRIMAWLSPLGPLSHVEQLFIPEDWIKNKPDIGWNLVRTTFGAKRIRFEDRSIDTNDEWRDLGWSEEEGKEDTWRSMEISSWDEGFWSLVDEVERR